MRFLWRSQYGIGTIHNQLKVAAVDFKHHYDIYRILWVTFKRFLFWPPPVLLLVNLVLYLLAEDAVFYCFLLYTV